MRHYAGGSFRDTPRDPFTIGAAIVTYTASSAAVLSFEAFVIASYAIGTVVVGGAIAGAQYALNQMMSDNASRGGALGGENPYQVNAPEVRGNVRRSDPAARFVYGEPECGGAVIFLDDSQPPYLTLGVAYSARRLGGIRYLKIGEHTVPFRDFDFDQVLTPLAPTVGTDEPDYSTALQCSFRRGLYTQAKDLLLATHYPSLESTFRQDETATGFYRFAYGADFDAFEERWGKVAIPSPLIGASGAAVYDPRDPSQRYPLDWDDREDVADAMAGWSTKREACLVQADWLGHPDGLAYPPDRIRWDEIAKSADFDGEMIPTKDGGLVMRHPIDGIVSLNQKPNTVMEAMLTANAGIKVESRGRGWIQSSRPKDVRLTIDDSILAGGFRFRDDKALRDTFNSIVARIPSADRENQDVDIPVLRRQDLIDEDREELTATVRLPFTKEHQTAQRLARQFVDQSRLPRALQCRIKNNKGGLGLEVGDVVAVYSRIYPRMNAEYTIEELGIIEDFSGVTLALVEYDREISKRWNALEHELPFERAELTVA